MHAKKAARCCAAFLCLLFAACTSRAPLQQREAVVLLGQEAGFTSQIVSAAGMRIFALLRHGEGRRLRVYIEGDGKAWPTPYWPPDDPTPANLLVVRMALADSASHVAYLARPCQYLADSGCLEKYWTTHRYTTEVLGVYLSLLDELKRTSTVEEFSLVGYSGGGVLAAHLAMARSDVVELLTIAAPLDLDGWSNYHQLTPMAERLPPLMPAEMVHLRQHHWLGGRDQVVPAALMLDFHRQGAGERVVSLLPTYDHECCWAEDWPHWVSKTGRFRLKEGE